MKVIHIKVFPGNTLKALRRSAGITQTELSALVGISMRTLVRYENGEKELSDLPVGLAQKIADVLGVDVAKLVKGIALDNRIMRNRDLSFTGLGLYATLASFRKKEIPLDGNIKRNQGDTDEEINAALDELVRFGYIEIAEAEDIAEEKQPN